MRTFGQTVINIWPDLGYNLNNWVKGREWNGRGENNKIRQESGTKELRTEGKFNE